MKLFCDGKKEFLKQKNKIVNTYWPAMLPVYSTTLKFFFHQRSAWFFCQSKSNWS